MGRYGMLYLYFLRFSFSRAMEFRLDFFFRIVMDTVYYIVHIIFFGVIYGHTSMIGGWNFDQILIFMCGFFLVDAIHMTVHANNIWALPEHVNKGDLDYYLIRPVSSLFFLSHRDFAANSFVNLLIAAGMLTWALLRYPGEFSTVQVLVFLGLLLNGAYLYWGIHMCFVIPVFWTHSAHGFQMLFYSLKQFAERPDPIFQGWIRRTLTTFLPFLIIASFPARILFEGLSLSILIHSALVSLGLSLFLLWFWKKALRSYSSASS
jgi:ABC-2 type transport system permease protein